MPELPEVEIVCRGLEKALCGARITFAKAHRADLRTPLPSHLGSRLTGCKILNVTRRAKYILIALDNDQTLVLHLGMSGRILLSHEDAPLQKHDHISLSFDNGLHARFNDPRRFGRCELVATKGLFEHKLLCALGIEPLGTTFTPEGLGVLLKGRKTAIKLALMDQRLVVGIGNIYACEALFKARINPECRAGDCSPDELKKLVAAIRKILNAAIAAGGSSLRNYVQTDGGAGSFQKQFSVYGREGERCPGCDCAFSKTKGIHRIVQGGRSTFYCSHKQK